MLITKKYIERRKLRFYAGMVTVNPSSSPSSMQNSIKEQLKNYSMVTKKNTRNIHEEPRIMLTGKLGQGTDDSAMCIQIGLVVKSIFNEMIHTEEQGLSINNNRIIFQIKRIGFIC